MAEICSFLCVYVTLPCVVVSINMFNGNLIERKSVNPGCSCQTSITADHISETLLSTSIGLMPLLVGQTIVWKCKSIHYGDLVFLTNFGVPAIDRTSTAAITPV